MVLRIWGELVVTEWTPVHQAREKSHGWLITYRLVVMFTAAYSLHTQVRRKVTMCYKTPRGIFYTHTHCNTVPGELRGHGAVVQVEFDDVVTLEFL